jgi:plastocyanin
MARTKSWSILALGVCVVAWAGRVGAAEVQGQLLLAPYKPVVEAAPPRPAFQWEVENGVKEVLPDRVDAKREIAVVLLGEGAPVGDGRVEVPISGGSLLPSTIVVRTGTTLRIRNDDEIAHEVEAVGLAGFSSEAISPRGVRSVSLATAGGWPMRDKLVTHAHGYLHVLPNLVASARVETGGKFVFPDVPAGKYTLKVFHGATELSSSEVTVESKALSVNPITLAAPAAKP